MVRIGLIFLIVFKSGMIFGQEFLGDKSRNIYDLTIKKSMLGAITDNSIELWDLNSKTKIKSIDYKSSDVLSAVCFGADSMVLITGTRSGGVNQWNMNTGEKIQIEPPGIQGAVTSIDFNSARKLLAVGFSNKRMSLYDFENLKKNFKDTNYLSDVTAVKFTKDNEGLLTGDGEGKLSWISLDSKMVKTIDVGDASWIRSIAVSNDSTLIAVAKDRNSITYLRATKLDKENSSKARMFGSWITALDFYSGKLRCIAYANASGEIKIIINQGEYTYKAKTLINQIRFIPSNDHSLCLALATMGKGLQLVRAGAMKYHP